MLVALVLCGLGTAWGQAPVNTTLWQETWTGGETGIMPSNYGFEGTTVYGEATLTYGQSDNNTKLFAETLAGGTSPELLLSKSNKTWTISNIPTGQATEMSLTFLSNKTTFAVTSSTKGITISGSQKSWTITATSGVTSFNLTIKNTGSANARIDNVELKVTTAGSSSTLTSSDLTLAGDPVALEFDLYNNSTAQTISYTTSSTGAVTISASDYVTTSVNEANKTITVTPKAVTPSAQTITVSQAADDTYDEGSATFTVTISNNDPDRLGGANNPYTVAQALENTPASGNSEDVYVKGIVSKFQAADIMSDGANYRYYISDDGTTNNQLLVYKGKGLNNVDFSNADDLQIGDFVVVKGPLSTYNSTKEINSGNYIVSLTRKAVPTLSFGENAYSVVKNGTLTISATSNSTGAITYESSNTDVAEIDATSGAVTAKAAGTSTITATITATDDYKSITATVELTVTAPKHKVTFYQNGTKLSEEEVSEDATITFPEAEAEINGKAFVGWIASTIEGETNDAPAFVTTATMGTSDVNYYAVFAILEGESTGTYTLDYDAETQLKNATLGYGNAVNYTATDGSQWVVKAYKSSGMQINKSKNSSIKVPTCPGAITSIAITGSTEKAVGFSANDYNGSGTINYLAEGSDATEQTLDLSEQNTTSGYIVPKSGSISITKIVVNYSSTSYSAYCTTVLPPIELAKPIIFHDGGTYEQALKVAMAGQGTIKYKLNGGAEQTYSTPIDVNETTTITAWVEQDGSKSDEISKTFTIEAKEAGPSIEDGYYTIKNNGNGKYVNVAGRRTVTFVDETATAAAPGTIIKVKATDGQLEVLRSQGVDLPAYAEKAMNYVPQIVQLVVDKLHIEGSGELLGENGLKALMKKFDESFDYHLYLEKAGDYYRIYGRTPSMQPVVDFYAENKDNVDAKLPGLEEFINSAIQKILNKTNGSGASILVPFSLETVWENMGGTLTNPAENQAKFYEEVLSSEANVWNFAYQTAMLYWGNLKKHQRYEEIKGNLGDLAKYIDKVENIQPNSKYYIVQQNGQMDIINQSNSVFISDIAAEADFTAWTLKERSKFQVTFPEANVKNAGMEHYTTLYTDFAYTLPEGTKALKVKSINEKTGVAVTEEITGTIPAQTPVMLATTNEELTQTLTLAADGGAAVTDNLLVGPDFLIEKYGIKTAQIESLFDAAKEILGEEAYNTYLAEYEHLMFRNSGTVNNKYFFGIGVEDDTEANDIYGPGTLLRMLNTGSEKLGFYLPQDVIAANQAFIMSEVSPVKLFLKGDVNRDGVVNVTDVSATIDISLGKATPETHSDVYDFDAADADENGTVNVNDAVIIVNISLGKQ